MELFADDLADLLDAIHISEKIVLCGLSMGGYIAFAFFRKYGSRLAGLILTATRALPDNETAKANREKALAQVQTEGITRIVDDMLPKLVAPATMQDNPALVDNLRQIMLSTSLDGVKGDLSGMKNRPDSTPLLSQINIPTLLVFGAQDQIIPLDEARAMHTAIRGSRLEIIADAGHLLNLERPKMYNETVRHFILEDIQR